jgi:hypothetical protein
MLGVDASLMPQAGAQPWHQLQVQLQEQQQQQQQIG